MPLNPLQALSAKLLADTCKESHQIFLQSRRDEPNTAIGSAIRSIRSLRRNAVNDALLLLYRWCAILYIRGGRWKAVLCKVFPCDSQLTRIVNQNLQLHGWPDQESNANVAQRVSRASAAPQLLTSTVRSPALDPYAD